MPGLIDSDTGLVFGDGLIWLEGGLGGPGLTPPPSDTMETEAGVEMLTETGEFMITEA
jgi:hypothetical protein